VFSVIYAGLINPYPFVAADRIVRLTMQSKAGQADWINLNGPQIRQLRQLGIVESLLAMDYHAMILTGHEVPENVNAIGLIAFGKYQASGINRRWTEAVRISAVSAPIGIVRMPRFVLSLSK
jgi:hypothetical protein